MMRWRGAWIVVGTACLPILAAHAAITRSSKLIDGSGPAAVTLARYFDPTGEPHVTVVIDRAGDADPALATIGPPLDRLLSETDRKEPLPVTFSVRPGGIRDGLIAELQRELRQPGANWNLVTGKPVRGDNGTVLQDMLARIIARSPLTQVFHRHGYSLRLDAIARITYDPPHPRSLGWVPGAYRRDVSRCAEGARLMAHRPLPPFDTLVANFPHGQSPAGVKKLIGGAHAAAA